MKDQLRGSARELDDRWDDEWSDRHPALNAALSVLRWTVVALGGAAVLITVLGLVFGWQPAIVRTGSMAPAVPQGSVVLLRPADPATVEVGEILGAREGTKLILHRVVSVTTADSGAITLTMKGDANTAADPAVTVTKVYRPLVTLPAIAQPLTRLNGPMQQFILGLLAGGMVAVLVWRRTVTNTRDEDEAEILAAWKAELVDLNQERTAEEAKLKAGATFPGAHPSAAVSSPAPEDALLAAQEAAVKAATPESAPAILPAAKRKPLPIAEVRPISREAALAQAQAAAEAAAVAAASDRTETDPDDADFAAPMFTAAPSLRRPGAAAFPASAGSVSAGSVSAGVPLAGPVSAGQPFAAKPSSVLTGSTFTPNPVTAASTSAAVAADQSITDEWAGLTSAPAPVPPAPVLPASVVPALASGALASGAPASGALASGAPVPGAPVPGAPGPAPNATASEPVAAPVGTAPEPAPLRAPVDATPVPVARPAPVAATAPASVSAEPVHAFAAAHAPFAAHAPIAASAPPPATTPADPLPPASGSGSSTTLAEARVPASPVPAASLRPKLPALGPVSRPVAPAVTAAAAPFGGLAPATKAPTALGSIAASAAPAAATAAQLASSFRGPKPRVDDSEAAPQATAPAQAPTAPAPAATSAPTHSARTGGYQAFARRQPTADSGSQPNPQPVFQTEPEPQPESQTKPQPQTQTKPDLPRPRVSLEQPQERPLEQPQERPAQATPRADQQGNDPRARDREVLHSFGVPERWTRHLQGPDRFEAVFQMLTLAPELSDVLDLRVVAVIGSPHSVQRESHRIAVELQDGVHPRPVLRLPISVPAAGAPQVLVAMPSSTNGPVVVAIECPDGAEKIGVAAIPAVDADLVVASIRSRRPHGELMAALRDLHRPLAVSFDGPARLPDVMPFLAAGVPVVRVDGVPLDRLSLTALLCGYLTAAPGSHPENAGGVLIDAASMAAGVLVGADGTGRLP